MILVNLITTLLIIKSLASKKNMRNFSMSRVVPLNKYYLKVRR